MAAEEVEDGGYQMTPQQIADQEELAAIAYGRPRGPTTPIVSIQPALWPLFERFARIHGLILEGGSPPGYWRLRKPGPSV